MATKWLNSFLVLLATSGLVKVAAKMKGGFVKFEPRKWGPQIIPYELYNGLLSPTVCATKCLAANTLGYCCTGFSFASNGTCWLYDADPEIYQPIPPGQTTDDVINVLPDSPVCQVAFIVGGNLLPTGVVPYTELYSPNGGCSHNLASLPLSLDRLGFFYFGKDILICGGYDASVITANVNCWRYDVPTDTWNLHSTVVNAHHGNTPYLAYKEKAYCLDWWNGEVYDNSTKVWKIDVTAPIDIGNGECSVSYKDSFFIFGGQSNTKMVQKYNLTTKQWTFPFTLNNGIYYSSCLLLPNSNGKVIFLAVETQASTTQTAAIVDLETNQQTSIATPTNLRALGSNLVALGSRIFSINGQAGTSNVATVEEYHPEVDTWSAVAAPLFYARNRAGALSVPASWFKKLPGGCRGAI